MGDPSQKATVPVITGEGGGYMSEAEATKAFQAGTARAPKDASELAAIRGQEAQALKSEQYGGLGGAAKAFAVKAVDVTGLAKPLAVGWERMANGDAAANQLSENLKGLEEENQIASGLGTAASFLAPGAIGKAGGALAKGEGLLAKGAGLVGRTGEAAALPMKGLSALGRGAEGLGTRVLGEGALGTIGSKALGFGAETAAFGAQHELSNQLTEEALGNPALNAERIFSAAGHDFVYGAVLGGALGVGSVVGKKALGGVSSLLKGKGLSEAADEFAGSQTYRTLGGTQKMSRNAEAYVPGGTAEVGNTVAKDAKAVLGREARTIEDLSAVIEKKLPEVGQRLGDMRAKASEVLEKSGQSLKAYDTLLSTEAAVLKDIKGVKAIGQEAKIKAVQDFFNSARRNMGLVDSAGELIPGAEAQTIKLTDLDAIRTQASKQWFESGAIPQARNELLAGVKNNLRDLIQSKQALAGELGGVKLAEEIKAAERQYQIYKEAEKAVTNGLGREASNNTFGLTARGAGMTSGAVAGMLGGGPIGSLAAGAAGMVATKLGDKFIPLATARAARGLSKVLETAQVTKAAKLATDDAVRGMLDAPRAAAATLPASLELFGKTHEQRAVKVEKTIAALQDTAAQGQRIADRTAGLGTEAPKTATALAAQAANVNAYLLSKAPKPVLSSLSLVPWTQKPTYQDQEVAKFAQALKVAADPNHVIHMAARGLVSRDDVAALKAMYPEAYQDARQTFMSLMFDPKHQPKIQKLPLDKRLAIVTLFDIPTPLTEPGFVGAIQEGIAEQGSQQTPSDQAPQNARRGDAQQALSASDAMRTDTERLSHGAGSD